MSTWHQDRNRNPSLPGKGYTVISDAPGQMRTAMSFGEDKAMAMGSLERHRVNQPQMYHLLYKDGVPIA